MVLDFDKERWYNTPMKIVVHFNDGRSEESVHLTAQDADAYVDTLNDVACYDIVKENNNNEQNEQH